MTPEQLDCIPDDLLVVKFDGATALTRWLYARGWRMTLLELDTERRRRGIPNRRLRGDR